MWLWIQPVSTKEPEGYESSYKSKQDEMLSEYLDREPFEFNINTDKLYNQYADQYKRQGEAAMRDTIADAASKTGGYTSSYGITAGSQAYQSYLDKLNDIVPVLESAAYDRYTDEAKGMEDKLEVLGELDDREYDKYRDRVEDYKDTREYYRKLYEYDNDADLDMYKALTDYILSLAKLENGDHHDLLDWELALEKLYMG